MGQEKYGAALELLTRLFESGEDVEVRGEGPLERSGRVLQMGVRVIRSGCEV